MSSSFLRQKFRSRSGYGYLPPVSCRTDLVGVYMLCTGHFDLGAATELHPWNANSRVICIAAMLRGSVLPHAASSGLVAAPNPTEGERKLRGSMVLPHAASSGLVASPTVSRRENGSCAAAWVLPMLPRSFRYPSVKQSLQDRTDIWRNVTI